MTPLWSLTSLLILILDPLPLSAHREHKVHNIVLYPDKQSWCKTTQIKQVVTWPKCSSQELDNNVCVGACFSYMVPHSEPSAPGDIILPYCDSCQPLDFVWQTVSLDCKDDEGKPTMMQKKVQIITNCSCSSCLEISKMKPGYSTLLQTLPEDNIDKNVNVPHEAPDILLKPNLNSSKTTTIDAGLNEKFRRILKQLKESGKLDEFETKELFSKFEDQEFDLQKLQNLLHKYADLDKDQEGKEEEKSKESQTVEKAESEIGREVPQLLLNQPQLPQEEEEQEEEEEEDEEELAQAPQEIPPALMHRGPHHSMVLESDVKEKIDVEPHYLQPAVPGQEISYHDNVLVDKNKKKDF